MKIKVDNFSYKGRYFEEWECDIPEVNENTSDKEKIKKFTEKLDEYLKNEEA